jgi:hypothetical protein
LRKSSNDSVGAIGAARRIAYPTAMDLVIARPQTRLNGTSAIW